MRVLICLSLSLTIGQAALAQDMHLICLGGGNATKHSNTNSYAFDNRGHAANGFSSSTYGQGFQDQADVEIVGGMARVRLPRVMLPAFHGGSDGWMPMKNLTVTDRAIDGEAGINFINHPKVHIDRITGIATITGKAGQFTGECQPYDPATAQRKF